MQNDVPHFMGAPQSKKAKVIALKIHNEKKFHSKLIFK